MGIESFSGAPVSGFSRSFSSINPPNRAKAAKVRAVADDGEQAKTKESASVQVSITTDRSQSNPVNHKVAFDVDPESKDVVIKLLNKETVEEVRQIPTEDVLRLSQRIGEFQDKLLDLG